VPLGYARTAREFHGRPGETGKQPWILPGAMTVVQRAGTKRWSRGPGGGRRARRRRSADVSLSEAGPAPHLPAAGPATGGSTPGRRTRDQARGGREDAGSPASIAGSVRRRAGRAARRDPGFALAVLLALAVGIGLGAPVSGLVRAGLLRPAPYGDPRRARRAAPAAGGPAARRTGALALAGGGLGLLLGAAVGALLRRTWPAEASPWAEAGGDACAASPPRRTAHARRASTRSAC
jgi:large exoprotein involved in heme utilization and adhesion